jgi:hypothetical protein
MRDITSNFLVKRAISPVSVSDNTAQVSQIIDRQGFDSLMFAIAIGSVADADVTFTTLLEESDNSDLSSGNAVADADMTSQTYGTAPETAASFQFDDDNEVRKIGYLGNKRYVRLTITPANNASAALLAAVAILGHAGQKPVTQSAS